MDGLGLLSNHLINGRLNEIVIATNEPMTSSSSFFRKMTCSLVLFEFLIYPSRSLFVLMARMYSRSFGIHAYSFFLLYLALLFLVLEVSSPSFPFTDTFLFTHIALPHYIPLFQDRGSHQTTAHYKQALTNLLEPSLHSSPAPFFLAICPSLACLVLTFISYPYRLIPSTNYITPFSVST